MLTNDTALSIRKLNMALMVAILITSNQAYPHVHICNRTCFISVCWCVYITGILISHAKDKHDLWQLVSCVPVH